LFLADIFKSFKVEEFPIDLKEKLFNKFGIKIESVVKSEINLSEFKALDKIKEESNERIIVENR